MQAIVKGQEVEDVKIVTHKLQLTPSEYTRFKLANEELLGEISGNGASIISVVNYDVNEDVKEAEIMSTDMKLEDTIESLQDQKEEDKEDDPANVIMSQVIELTDFYSAAYMGGA